MERWGGASGGGGDRARSGSRTLGLGVCLAAAVACGSPAVAMAPTAAAGPAQEPMCRVVEAGIELPGSLDETSGLAVGMRNPAIIWSHSDGGNPSRVIGLDRDGQKVAEFDVEIRNRDWEDMDIGPCSLGNCLYIADVGDNEERRDNLRVVRMVEPAADVTRIDPARFDVVLPDGPRDIESIYVLPGEQLFFVTKGRNHPVTVYRYPGPLRDEEVVLEQVQVLASVVNPMHWVTGASATADGRYVAIRSYATLYIYQVNPDGSLEVLPEGRVSLLPIREPQGEAVAWGGNGVLYLTSEKRAGQPATMTVMQCSLPDANG